MTWGLAFTFCGGCSQGLSTAITIGHMETHHNLQITTGSQPPTMNVAVKEEGATMNEGQFLQVSHSGSLCLATGTCTKTSELLRDRKNTMCRGHGFAEK